MCEPMIDLAKMIIQLQSAKVVLKKLPPSAITGKLSRNKIIFTVQYNKCSSSNTETALLNKTVYNFVSKIIMLHCSKCNETTEGARIYGQNCRKCGTILVYQCKKCNKKFDKYYKLSYHSKYKCYPETYFPCPECDYGTTIKPCLDSHLKRIHFHLHGSFNSKKNKKSTLCNYCSFQTKYKQNLARHFIRIHMKNECNVANSVIKEKKNEVIKTERTKVLTLDENLATVSSDLVAQPNNEDINNRGGRKKCSKCGKRFNSLKEHVKFCGKKPKLYCEWCPFKTNYKGNWRRHMRNHHRQSRNKMFTKTANSKINIECS